MKVTSDFPRPFSRAALCTILSPFFYMLHLLSANKQHKFSNFPLEINLPNLQKQATRSLAVNLSMTVRWHDDVFSCRLHSFRQLPQRGQKVVVQFSSMHRLAPLNTKITSSQSSSYLLSNECPPYPRPNAAENLLNHVFLPS